MIDRIMTNKKAFAVILSIILIITALSPVMALTVKSVDYARLTPGSQSTLVIKLENELNWDIQDVSLSLVTANTPFSIIGSSEDSVDEINEDDDETFTFTIKASSSAKPGDYEIPYTAKYEAGNDTKSKSGSVGVTISGSPSIEYSVSAEKPVMGERTKLRFKIINKGFADAKFVSVKATPQGYALLSEDNVYIGGVESDDFETADFDVYLNTLNPFFNAVVQYTDFDNKKITDNIQLPIKVYDREKALELGIIQKSNGLLYALIIAVIIIAWITWRIIKKRRARKRISGGR